MKAYTDYPLVELGDTEGQKAEIRAVNVLGYDGDKYVTVLFNGKEYEIKAGYVYSEPGRCGDVPAINPHEIA